MEKGMNNHVNILFYFFRQKKKILVPNSHTLLLHQRLFLFHFLILLLFFFRLNSHAQVTDFTPTELQKIDVVEQLGDSISLDLVFTDENGKEAMLSQFFNQGKPVIIILAYYRCPMLCSLVLNGYTNAAKDLSFLPGQDYSILTISIDPRETYDLALAKKQNYLKNFNKPGVETGWTWCVSQEKQVKQLADDLGFIYFYDKDKDQYAHPAVLHILTPEGKISRYLYGIEFNPNDLKLSLLEASKGLIGNSVDKLLLYCFHYDPNSRGYVVFAGNIMKLGGVVTLIVLSLFLGILWIREHNRTKMST